MTLNRADEWKRAVLCGLRIDGNVLRGIDNDGSIADSALMVTSSIDSFEHDHAWDQISFDWTFASNTNCRVSCFASNTNLLELEGETVNFDEWLADEKNTAPERAKRSAHMFTQIMTQDGDGLLSCRGRYLWIRLDVLTQDRAGFTLRSIKLRLPGERIVGYLPDIYRRGAAEDEFLHRFMAVFDSIFFRIENDINRIGEKLDYRTASTEMLAYLAAWLGINGRTASAEALRTQIGSAVHEYRTSGTREGLLRAIERQTGIVPIIVEYFQVEKMVREGRDKLTYTNLFGSNPYRVHIILPEHLISSKERIDALDSKIRSCVPAHVEFELLPLHMSFRLDRHTYLEINSYLSDFSNLVIEEKSTLYHDVYIGGQSDEK